MLKFSHCVFWGRGGPCVEEVGGRDKGWVGARLAVEGDLVWDDTKTTAQQRTGTFVGNGQEAKEIITSLS